MYKEKGIEIMKLLLADSLHLYSIHVCTGRFLKIHRRSVVYTSPPSTSVTSQITNYPKMLLHNKPYLLYPKSYLFSKTSI